MAVTIGNIPVYEAILGTDGGMLRVSLVDRPAVMKNFVAMRDASVRHLYAIADEDRHIVRGPIMRADFPIYRKDEENGEYYVIYKADTIREMAERYLAENRQNLVDLMHDGADVKGVEMVQLYIKDAAAGISPEGFGDIADGSLFAEFHVTDSDIWERVKDGTYRGFSIEGIFDLVPVADSRDREIENIVRGLNGLFNIFKKDMSKISKLKAALAKILVELRNVTTDRGIVYWDGDEDLRAGDAVYTGEGADRIPAPDGDYKTEDGKTIRIADGEVSEILDPDAEVEGYDDDGSGGSSPVSVEARVAFARRVREKMEASFDEKAQSISAAILDVLPEDRKDGYLAEAGEDYGVFVWWDEDYITHFVRYSISWNEAGEASAADPVDVVPRFVPVDAVDEVERITEEEYSAAVNKATALAAERDRLKARVAELEKKPAAPSAHEAYDAGPARRTGDKGLDNLARFAK